MRAGGADEAGIPAGFKSFQWAYLTVYLIIMMADWLQGPNMWTLYASYGVDISTLFVSGFVSSAVCSSFVGGWIDAYGRKAGCIVYCLLELLINVMEHSPSFEVL